MTKLVAVVTSDGLKTWNDPDETIPTAVVFERGMTELPHLSTEEISRLQEHLQEATEVKSRLEARERRLDQARREQHMLAERFSNFGQSR